MEASKGFIFEIQKMSTEDGPGIRTTVFFKQCPLRCIWCHNPESISKKPQLEWIEHKCIGCKTCIETCQLNALSFSKEGLHINRDLCTSCGDCVEECPSTALHMYGQWWDLNDLYHEIKKDKVYYTQSKGGLTVSGGEPTAQSQFITKLLNICQENGISTALDTCGYAPRKVYETILPYVDLILLDIKEIDPKKHKTYTGVSNELILKNAVCISRYIKEHHKEMWVRTPIIPNYTATEDNIKGIAKFILNELNNVPDRWDLLAFNNLCYAKYRRLDMDWPLKDYPLLKKEEIEHFQKLASKIGVKNVQWSGLTRKEENSNQSIN